MSKNAATIAEAISLLSDVLVHDTAWEAETETSNSIEYDDLKEETLEFARDMADNLGIINDDLDRVLDLDDEINGEADEIDIADWPAPDYSISSIRDCHDDAEADAEDDDEADEPGNGEVDISDTDPVLGPDDDDDKNDDEMISHLKNAEQVLLDEEERNNKLEKTNEELSDRIEDLIDTIRDVATNIKRMNGSADDFVSEVEDI